MKSDLILFFPKKLQVSLPFLWNGLGLFLCSKHCYSKNSYKNLIPLIFLRFSCEPNRALGVGWRAMGIFLYFANLLNNFSIMYPQYACIRVGQYYFMNANGVATTILQYISTNVRVSPTGVQEKRQLKSVSWDGPVLLMEIQFLDLRRDEGNIVSTKKQREVLENCQSKKETLLFPI